MTSSIGSLHTLTVKYARTANQILDVLLPIIKNVPIVPKNVTAVTKTITAIIPKQ